MPSTYLDLCNTVLRRLNEVEIAASEFDTVRGVQALAKDSVKTAVSKINQAEFEWPFNAAEHTQLLVQGQEEYVWPEFLKVADWNSFQIQKNTGLNTGFKTLKLIDRDEWYARHRDGDYDSGNQGRGVPDYVFASHGNGFGVSPSPDAAYSVRFRYYLNYANLAAFNDQTRIPTSFDSVVVDGALYHMYMFKDNTEAAQAAFMSFENGIKDLQTLYINNFEYVRDTRVNF